MKWGEIVLASLNYQFRNSHLREQALTHRSLGVPNNERLEFLGDALINLLVAELIYEQHPKANEGKLTRLRASLVNGSALANMARKLELGDQIRLGTGELKSGGYRRESILSDAFEALIAAVYLDGGWEICRQIIRELFAELAANTNSANEKDPKTRLQELLQAQSLALPQYEVLAASGEEHDKRFEVSCSVPTLNAYASGSGSSRRAAEQSAATLVLIQIETQLK